MHLSLIIGDLASAATTRGYPQIESLLQGHDNLCLSSCHSATRLGGLRGPVTDAASSLSPEVPRPRRRSLLELRFTQTIAFVVPFSPRSFHSSFASIA